MRSAMFVPGHRQRFIDKALGELTADVFIFDIEDGVVPAEKPTARAQIAAALGQSRGAARSLRYVRVNAVGSDWFAADMGAVIRPGLDGLVVPKVDWPDQVQQVDRVVAEREAAASLAPGSIRYILAVEGPRGLINAPAIAAASPRVAALMFGAEDYGRELGLPARREGEAAELIFARSSLVNAAAAANVQAIDGVWPDIHDFEGLARDCLQSRRLGFSGKSLFHPGQIDHINATFTPTEAELDYARQVVAAMDEAMARGEGAVAFGGQLLDLPIVERARRALALAETLRAADRTTKNEC
jgi:citrate lyase subunit beta/citryl-CoA lyase